MEISEQKMDYWDGVAAAWVKEGRQRLWRAYSDRLHGEFFGRWMPRAAERALKTDLFDEATSAGLVPLLACRAREVAGVDVSAAVVEAAKARYPALDAVVGDVRKLPFGDASFDLVISNSTLDHFHGAEDILTSLRELSRVLRPGGQMIVTMDNRANPAVALRNALPFGFLNRLGVLPYYVGATFGPGGLRRALEKTGFEVADMNAVMHCPRALAVAAAHFLEKSASKGARERFLKGLMAFERLSRWPTRFLTGYFIAAKAVKPR
ncbi:MAG: class I SAM-dependent methyltransferase [Candidatus Omnitrophota bacterium]